MKLCSLLQHDNKIQKWASLNNICAILMNWGKKKKKKKITAKAHIREIHRNLKTLLSIGTFWHWDLVKRDQVSWTQRNRNVSDYWLLIKSTCTINCLVLDYGRCCPQEIFFVSNQIPRRGDSSSEEGGGSQDRRIGTVFILILFWQTIVAILHKYVG